MSSFNKLANLHRVFFKQAEKPVMKYKTNEEAIAANRGADARAGSLIYPPGSNFKPETYLAPGVGKGLIGKNVKANVPVPTANRVPVSAHPSIPNPLRPNSPPSDELIGNELAQQHTMKATGRFGGAANPENNGYNTGKGINTQGTSWFGENPTHGFGEGAGETLKPRIAKFNQ